MIILDKTGEMSYFIVLNCLIFLAIPHIGTNDVWWYINIQLKAQKYIYFLLIYIYIYIRYWQRICIYKAILPINILFAYADIIWSIICNKDWYAYLNSHRLFSVGDDVRLGRGHGAWGVGWGSDYAGGGAEGGELQAVQGQGPGPHPHGLILPLS